MHNGTAFSVCVCVCVCVCTRTNTSLKHTLYDSGVFFTKSSASQPLNKIIGRQLTIENRHRESSRFFLNQDTIYSNNTPSGSRYSETQSEIGTHTNKTFTDCILQHSLFHTHNYTYTQVYIHTCISSVKFTLSHITQ